MQVQDLKLEEISFNSAPTKTQLTNSLRSISRFLSHVGAALILDESYTVADQSLGQMFNAAITLKACADQFDAGPSASGLAVPQPAGPHVVRGH